MPLPLLKPAGVFVTKADSAAMIGPHDEVFDLVARAQRASTATTDWAPVWRSPEPRAHYQVIVVGAGGHGLATAYYLAKEHGISDVAVLEKGWLGGGNTGRNTTIIRSNYLWDESARIYDHAVSCGRG